jgi:RNA polymerase sigma-70 factor, ECF subfamily
VERSDWDLVRESRRGDQEAFRELFDRYHRQVLAVAVGMTGNPDDAMDVAQETFLRAHRNLGAFLGESSFYTWLYRIAVNVAIDHRRRDARRAEVPSDTEMLEETHAAERTSEPDAGASSAELRQTLLSAIDELTPEHKAAIVLREIEGLSYEDISKVMQCSKGTVMSRLHYARKKLQGRLADLLK